MSKLICISMPSQHTKMNQVEKAPITHTKTLSILNNITCVKDLIIQSHGMCAIFNIWYDGFFVL